MSVHSESLQSIHLQLGNIKSGFNVNSGTTSETPSPSRIYSYPNSVSIFANKSSKAVPHSDNTFVVTETSSYSSPTLSTAFFHEPIRLLTASNTCLRFSFTYA